MWKHKCDNQRSKSQPCLWATERDLWALADFAFPALDFFLCCSRMGWGSNCPESSCVFSPDSSLECMICTDMEGNIRVFHKAFHIWSVHFGMLTRRFPSRSISTISLTMTQYANDFFLTLQWSPHLTYQSLKETMLQQFGIPPRAILVMNFLKHTT